MQKTYNHPTIKLLRPDINSTAARTLMRAARKSGGEERRACGGKLKIFLIFFGPFYYQEKKGRKAHKEPPNIALNVNAIPKGKTKAPQQYPLPITT